MPTMPQPMSASDSELLREVLEGRRRAMSRAITLLESTRADHRSRADALLHQLLAHSGNALRLGISGVPGVGKSTFIESLGMRLLQKGMRVAVLSVDPSSAVSGGSILADKTRMTRLAASEQAFIRPSPSSGVLGGVAASTREAMLVCEAAGYDVVIVETVGVGQSESSVAGMTDLLLLLQLPNAGDDLQAIKRGVLELADIVAINKVDLDPEAARRAALQLGAARQEDVRCVSAADGTGMDDLWDEVARLRAQRCDNGELEARRRRQSVTWMWELLRAGLEERLREQPALTARLAKLESSVMKSEVPPRVAARELLDCIWERN